ncbi:MAG: heme A synthase [Chloroflexi bacterium]|nr:heme A synthase [Chloroflexota bacterium]
MASMTRFQRVGLGLVIGLLALTALGGIVRVTGSGLACPDWPGCYGAVIPSGDFGEFAAHQVWLEWTHRLVAAIMGLIILGYAIVAWLKRRDQVRIWLPAVLSIPLLAVQVVLGGLTVTERLEELIVTLHLATAMLILMVVAFSWLSTFQWRVVNSEDEAPLGSDSPSQARSYAWVALLTAVIVYAVVVVGSYVTHVGAGPDAGAHVGPGGAACGNNWPFCYGGLFPDGEYAQWNMGHRFLVLFGAIALFASAMGVVMLRPRARGLTFMVHGAATLYVAQIFIGAAMIWINFDAWARALHLSMGSITWLLVSGAALVAIYRAGGLRRHSEPATALQPAGIADAGVSAESESNG